MRGLIIVIAFLVSLTLSSQEKFLFTENGLTPTSIVSKIDGLEKTKAYEKALSWIQTNYKSATIETDVANTLITLTETKENFVNEGKRYLHVKYRVKIRFEDNQYTFEPIDIAAKINSKYDLGWKKIDEEEIATFFKRGRAIKSKKTYVKKIPRLFNELHRNLYKMLTSN